MDFLRIQKERGNPSILVLVQINPKLIRHKQRVKPTKKKKLPTTYTPDTNLNTNSTLSYEPLSFEDIRDKQPH